MVVCILNLACLLVFDEMRACLDYKGVARSSDTLMAQRCEYPSRKTLCLTDDLNRVTHSARLNA